MKFIVMIICFNLFYPSIIVQSDKLEAIQTIFNFEKFQDYLHTEIKDRFPYLILENKYFTKDSRITINDQPVLFEKKANIKGDNYLEIKRFVVQDKIIYFSIFYHLENVEFKGCLILNKNQWKIDDYDIIEY
jgi:hypothetical protein